MKLWIQRMNWTQLLQLLSKYKNTNRLKSHQQLCKAKRQIEYDENVHLTLIFTLIFVFWQAKQKKKKKN